MTCANCKFYEINPKDMRIGTCTRFPPQTLFVNGQALSAFPGVQHHQNCGEHKPRITIDGTKPATGVTQQ